MNSLIKPQIFDWLCIGIFMLTTLFMVGNNDISQLFLWVAVPIMFVRYVFDYKKNGLSLNVYEKRLFLLYVWITFTLIVSVDYEASFTELKLCWGAFAMVLIIKNIQNKSNMVYFILFIYVTYMIDLLLYALNNFIDIAIESERAGDDTVNANLLGYVAFFFNTSVYFIGECKNKLVSRLFKILHFSIVPLSFSLGLITASRQIMLINIPFFILLSCIRYNIANSRNLIIATVVVLVLVAYFGDSIIEIYDNSLLKSRTDESLSEDVRYILILNAIDIGLSNPLLGVGPNCFAVINHGMSHNSYLELFANSGIFAMLIYCSMFITFIKRQFIRFRKYRDTMYMTLLVFGITYAFYNFFYVFYRAPWLILFFMIIAAYSEHYYETNYRIRGIMAKKD